MLSNNGKRATRRIWVDPNHYSLSLTSYFLPSLTLILTAVSMASSSAQLMHVWLRHQRISPMGLTGLWVRSDPDPTHRVTSFARSSFFSLITTFTPPPVLQLRLRRTGTVSLPPPATLRWSVKSLMMSDTTTRIGDGEVRWCPCSKMETGILDLVGVRFRDSLEVRGKEVDGGEADGGDGDALWRMDLSLNYGQVDLVSGIFSYVVCRCSLWWRCQRSGRCSWG